MNLAMSADVLQTALLATGASCLVFGHWRFSLVCFGLAFYL